MMKQFYAVWIPLFSFACALSAQEIPLTETGASEQVYREPVESESLLPFNDLNVESGYVLYAAETEVKAEGAVLEFENVRDYAVVYLDGSLQGTVTDRNKTLKLKAGPGTYTLSLYAENIGRITYGPEILDNSKGLFGRIALDGETVGGWTIVPLGIRECDVSDLLFEEGKNDPLPAFHKGYFQLEEPRDVYLDVSGWGMGEVWVNGNYVGSYWEEERQQSIPVGAENLLKGKNELVVFDLKNNARKSMRLSGEPVFK